jgi:hypothetical protein
VTIAWQLILAALLFLLWLAGAIYAIVRWIYSDAPPGTPLPWERQRAKRAPKDGAYRRPGPSIAASRNGRRSSEPRDP